MEMVERDHYFQYLKKYLYFVCNFEEFVFSELTAKCVLEIGRFVKILEDQWKW
jgi:hypothetical protein